MGSPNFLQKYSERVLNVVHARVFLDLGRWAYGSLLTRAVEADKAAHDPDEVARQASLVFLYG